MEKETKTPKKEEVTRNLNESIITIRVQLGSADLKKSGKNKFAGFEYFELSDFLPTLNSLMCKEGVNDRFTIEEDEARLYLIKGEESQLYKLPFVMYEVPKNKQGMDSMQPIQYLGALVTYYKRYLYMNAFGITDGEVIDSMDNNDVFNANNAKVTATQIKKLTDVYVGDNMTKLLNTNGITKIEDLPFKKAQELLRKLKK